PITCPADFQRAHCSKCYWTGGSDGVTECQDCSSPYTLEDKACQLSCSSLPAPDPKPGMPDNAMKYNGISWPTVCFDDSEAHFFTIGDALLKFSRGAQELQQKGHDPRIECLLLPVTPRSSERLAVTHCMTSTAATIFIAMTSLVDSHIADPRRKKKAKQEETRQIQRVFKLAVLAHDLFETNPSQRGTPPRFVLNVGDNFYPGGINAHCDSVNTPEDSFLSWQFKQVFENMYPVQDLGNMEWWSVLGNHDYGGVCYIKGWDQQIFYTFKDGGRWIMPAQYWHRHVNFKTFDVDIWFLDTNVLDTQNPADNPDHNLCANRGNSDKFQFCEKNRFPPKEGSDASCMWAMKIPSLWQQWVGRTKHDIQTQPQHQLRGAFWNTTGLLEAAKLHSLIQLMKQHELSWLALTETHMKQPDQFMIEGYTITHSATEAYDSKGEPTQTFTGVSLITAPHLTPTITELTCIDGRFLHFTIDTVEAPLKIMAIYAPHNQREQAIRDTFWQQLNQHLTAHRERTALLVVGDFNALALDEIAAIPHAACPHFVPGKTAEDDEADRTEEGETNQRQLHDLLSSQDYCLPQSWMEKAPQHRHTHKRPNGDLVQLDHAIIHKDWRNIIHNVHTIPGAALNSNHFLVKVDLLLKTKEAKRTPPKPRHSRQPDPAQIQSFNKHIHQQELHNIPATDSSHPTPHLPLQAQAHTLWEQLQEATKKAIAENIPTTTSVPKHPRISQQTWDLIQQRSTARASQRFDEEVRLHKDIRKQARKDKTQWLKERLAESEATLDPRQKWRWIKRVRSDYKPRPVPIRDSQGKPTSQTQQAQTFAEYLRDSHWATPPAPYSGPTDPIHPPAPVDLSPIRQAELQAALKELAHNKAPGPDTIPAEAWQWLDTHNQAALLRVLNQALLTATIWHEAIVVEIYKGKGPLTDPSSYRPISLLSTSYKLFAKIIHTRLQAAIDDRQSLYTILLDWEKAFDKIHPQALLTALDRFGVPPHLTALIKNIYTSPQFTVAAAGHSSSKEEAQSGIRQGCSLSPYLFLVVHGMIMHDVDAELTANGEFLPWLYSQNQPFYDLAYADDTALLAGYTPGRGADAMSWQAISREAGIDLIISGHKHEQKVDLQCGVAAMEVSTEAAYQDLARRREEVLSSLGSWCQALKAIRAPQTAPLEADGDPKETSQLQSHLRDALFVEICNALAFPGAAALAKPATPAKVVSQRQVSKSAAVVSVRTPRTPQKPSPRGSRESLSSRATSLTPRPSPALSALGRKDARPVQPLVPRQRCPQTNNVPEKRPTGRIERTSERPVVTRSQQFQMPAFAGVRRSSSPRNSSQPLSARSSSLRY
ncbi:Pol, partial [Symbiodinium sp. CCMP2456]